MNKFTSSVCFAIGGLGAVVAFADNGVSYAGKRLICEGSTGFRRDSAGTVGHRFEALLTHDFKANLIENGLADVSDLPREVDYTVESPAEKITSLSFKTHSSYWRLTNKKRYSEQVFMAESPEELVKFLRSQNAISEHDADILISEHATMTSVSSTSDLFGGKEAMLPGPRTSFGYHLCKFDN